MIFTTTLKLNKEFGRVYRRGKNYVEPTLVTYVLSSRNKDVNQIGITASKKIGNAIKRNRARRIIRESYRQIEPTLKTGYMMVFVARKATTGVKQTDVLSVMKRQLSRAGVLKKDNKTQIKKGVKP